MKKTNYCMKLLIIQLKQNLNFLIENKNEVLDQHIFL